MPEKETKTLGGWESKCEALYCITQSLTLTLWNFAEVVFLSLLGPYTFVSPRTPPPPTENVN